jgi:hypothetical protein
VVRNVHERLVTAPIEVVGPLLDRLGGPDDVLWPSPAWAPMVLDGPLVIRWVHDAVVEEMFDNAERAVGHEPARPARRSPYVRLVRALGRTT